MKTPLDPIFYEIKLVVDDTIYDAFLIWLKEHIATLLTMTGFLSAQLFIATEPAPQKKHLTVLYKVSTQKHLNDYLTHHAARLRGEGTAKFGDQFSATRETLSPIPLTAKI